MYLGLDRVLALCVCGGGGGWSWGSLCHQSLFVSRQTIFSTGMGLYRCRPLPLCVFEIKSRLNELITIQIVALLFKALGHVAVLVLASGIMNELFWKIESFIAYQSLQQRQKINSFLVIIPLIV